MALAYFGMSLDEWRRLAMGSDTHADDVERLRVPLTVAALCSKGTNRPKRGPNRQDVRTLRV
jgi:hypothetical protein